MLPKENLYAPEKGIGLMLKCLHHEKQAMVSQKPRL